MSDEQDPNKPFVPPQEPSAGEQAQPAPQSVPLHTSVEDVPPPVSDAPPRPQAPPAPGPEPQSMGGAQVGGKPRSKKRLLLIILILLVVLGAAGFVMGLFGSDEVAMAPAPDSGGFADNLDGLPAFDEPAAGEVDPDPYLLEEEEPAGEPVVEGDMSEVDVPTLCADKFDEAYTMAGHDPMEYPEQRQQYIDMCIEQVAGAQE